MAQAVDEKGDDRKEETAILVCTHAASLIAIGRVLTGNMPDDDCKEDFKTFTCGISRFNRRSLSHAKSVQEFEPIEAGASIPQVEYKDGRGVAGGWTCVMNGDCAHLDGGEERGWWVTPSLLFLSWYLMLCRGFIDAETF